MIEPRQPSDKPHSRYPHVYAVVRWDEGPGDPQDHVSVTKVFWSRTTADAEVRRLTELNAGKRCRYFVVQTRLVEEAGSR